MLSACGVGVSTTFVLATHAAVEPGFAKPPDWFNVAVGLQLPVRIVVIHILSSLPIILTLIATVVIVAYAGSRFVSSISESRHGAQQLLAAQLCVGLALACIPVAISSDTYAYMLIGQVWGIHGMNPYATPTLYVHGGDPALNRLASLFGNPVPFGDAYGPLFTVLAGAIAKACAGMLSWEYLTYRVVAVVAAAAVSVALYHLLRAQRDALRNVGRFAFNPLVMLETAINGHNDMLMVAFAVSAFAFAEELPVLAGLCIGASMAVKLVSIVVLPFLIAVVARRGFLRSLMLVVPALAVLVLTFRPFWVGLQTIGGLNKDAQIAFSPAYLVNVLLFGPNFETRMSSVPFASLHHVPVLHRATWPHLVNLCFVALFCVAAIVLLVRFVRLRTVDELWKTLIAFVWASPIFNPWYFIWLAPMTAWRGPWPLYVQWMTYAALLYYPLMYGVANGNFVGPIPIVVAIAVFIVPAFVVAARLRAYTRAAISER
jgi:alpha-1,6-mannosyltransferase